VRDKDDEIRALDTMLVHLGKQNVRLSNAVLHMWATLHAIAKHGVAAADRDRARECLQRAFKPEEEGCSPVNAISTLATSWTDRRPSKLWRAGRKSSAPTSFPTSQPTPGCQQSAAD